MLNKKYLLILILLFTAAMALEAQCPMCRMTAETNMKNGGTAGAGLNAGILYMLVAPYLIVGGVAFWWWRNRRNTEDESITEEWVPSSEDNSAWN